MKNILIVEDDRWIAEQYSHLLEKAGYSSILAHNGYEAVDLIDEHEIDLMVIDIMLPGATGFSLINELKSYRDTKDIPIIICTSLADNIDFESVEGYGVLEILDKTTMCPSDLVETVGHILK